MIQQPKSTQVSTELGSRWQHVWTVWKGIHVTKPTNALMLKWYFLHIICPNSDIFFYLSWLLNINKSIYKTSYQDDVKLMSWQPVRYCSDPFFFFIRAQSIHSRCTTAYRLVVRPWIPPPPPPWFRRSHFRRQVPPRPYDARDPSSKRWNCGRECCAVFCPNADLHVTFGDLLHAANLRHGNDSFTSPLKEGVLRIFSPWKILTASAGFEPANLGT